MSILPPTRSPTSFHRPSTSSTSVDAPERPSRPSQKRIQTLSPRALQRPSLERPPNYFFPLRFMVAQSSTSASIAPLRMAKPRRNAPPVRTEQTRLSLREPSSSLTRKEVHSNATSTMSLSVLTATASIKTPSANLVVAANELAWLPQTLEVTKVTAILKAAHC